AAASAVLPDSSTNLTVVGTADVSDSGLSTNFLKPNFQAAFPGDTFDYVAPSGGSGQAIAAAENGTGGSALIVHAPSLENAFVGGGYSLEPVGRSLFWGDYILAGA